MHGAVARQSFQSFAHVDQQFYLRIIFICFTQFRIHLQCFINRDIEFLRDHLGNRIHKCIGKIHHASHITDHTSGSQSTKRHDLDYPVFTILTHNIVDHLLPSLEAEIHVDIGHGHTLRVEKTLKQKLIPDRVDICDLQTIRNNTSRCGATPRPYCDPVIFGIFNKVPYYEEIIYISHAADRIQLIAQPFFQLPGRLSIMFFKSFPA